MIAGSGEIQAAMFGGSGIRCEWKYINVGQAVRQAALTCMQIESLAVKTFAQSEASHVMFNGLLYSVLPI